MQITCSQNTIIAASTKKKIFEVVTKINMFTPWEEFLCNVHAVSSRPVTIIASTSFSSIALCMSPILSCQLRPTTRRKELNYRYTNFIHNFYKPSYCYRPLSGAVASFHGPCPIQILSLPTQIAKQRNCMTDGTSVKQRLLGRYSGCAWIKQLNFRVV